MNFIDNNKLANATETIGQRDWNSMMLGFRITDGFLSGLTLWIFLSLVGYGTKKNRWKRAAGTQSLYNGPVYISCTAMSGFFLLRQIATGAMFFPLDDFLCEIFSDVAVLVNSSFHMMIFLFYWIRQRVIFKHPLVRDQVSAFARVSSWVFLLFAVASSISLGLTDVIPDTRFAYQKICFDSNALQRSIYHPILIVMMWSIALGMCCYSVYIVKSLRPDSVAEPECELNHNGDNSTQVSRKLFKCFGKLTNSFDTERGPVHAAAHHTLWSSIAVTLLCVSIPIFSNIAIFHDFPVATKQVLNNILFFGCIIVILRVLPFFKSIIIFPIQVITRCRRKPVRLQLNNV